LNSERPRFGHTDLKWVVVTAVARRAAQRSVRIALKLMDTRSRSLLLRGTL
jgi:RNase P protein component